MAKMKRYNGEEDSFIEAGSGSSSDDKDYGGSSSGGEYAPESTEVKSTEAVKSKMVAKPKAKPVAKTVAKEVSKPAESAAKPDVTKMSLSERAKMSRESARSGSGPTDTRSVSERIRSAFGMGKRGSGNSIDFAGSGMGMKSGGTASSRADGIATKGKTRGKMC